MKEETGNSGKTEGYNESARFTTITVLLCDKLQQYLQNVQNCFQITEFN